MTANFFQYYARHPDLKAALLDLKENKSFARILAFLQERADFATARGLAEETEEGAHQRGAAIQLRQILELFDHAEDEPPTGAASANYPVEALSQ